VQPQFGLIWSLLPTRVLGDTVVLSRFFHKERQEKNPSLNSGLRKSATQYMNSKDLPFEQEDALLDREGRWVATASAQNWTLTRIWRSGWTSSGVAAADG